MTYAIPLHKRLRDMRDQAIRRPSYRVIYSHALTVAHMSGRMVADDHPSLARIEDALRAAKAGDTDALTLIERELARLFGDRTPPTARDGSDQS